MNSSPAWIWDRPDWPKFRWDQGRLAVPLSRARLAQGIALGAARAVDPVTMAGTAVDILVEDSMSTSAIEGERLDPAGLRSSIARHLGLPTAGLPTPSRGEEGLVGVLLDATMRSDVALSWDRLCAWQAALFPEGVSGFVRIRTGDLRGSAPMRVVSGRPGKERVHFVAPGREVLDAELVAFLAWFNSPPEGLDGLIRAGLAHLWFVTLHPFEDGNGRLARAIADMAVAQDERETMRIFSVSARLLRMRDAYYSALELAQRSTLDVTPWLDWFLVQVEEAAHVAEATIARTLGKARFWQRHQDTDLNERQRKVLNRLLDAGPGGFEGGLTTRKYVGMTRSSRATAFRDLAELVNKGCLRAAGGGGRSCSYEIVW